MKHKLKDVANLAGVSLTTASLVFSGQGRISEETRVRVLNAADFLGYIKKKKPLPLNDFTNIGILYSTDSEWAFAMSFIQPIIAEIERELKKTDLNTVLIPIHHEIEDEEILQKLGSINCKAVISIHFGKESLFSQLENSGIPVIIVMNNNFQSKFYSVCVDDFQVTGDGLMMLNLLDGVQLPIQILLEQSVAKTVSGQSSFTNARHTLCNDKVMTPFQMVAQCLSHLFGGEVQHGGRHFGGEAFPLYTRCRKQGALFVC